MKAEAYNMESEQINSQVYKNPRTRVLVADDDEVLRQVLVAFLEEEDCEVIQAENGSLAVDLFEKELPDIVLLDAVMPVMDGYQACRNIKEIPGAIDVPVLIITVMDNDTSIERGFDAGAIDYIPKPFNWTLLSHRINILVDSRREKKEKENLETRLRQAQKMEAIGQLTGGIAHDFNNILASIIGYNELAQEHTKSVSDDKLNGYLAQVHESGERARKLVVQMLAFSREAAETVVPTYLQEKITDSLQMLKPVLPSSIELTTTLDTSTPAVLTNPVQIDQILLNLVINARDAMAGKGQVNIKVHLVDIEQQECKSCHDLISGQYVELSIQDTGDGIDSGLLDRIFEPFYTTKEVGKGTGMGLAMVHGIIHGYGGHIIVDTVAKKGTTFRLLLPVMNAEQSLPDSETGKNIEGSAYKPRGRILLVDDEELVAKFEQNLLENNGYEVSVYNNSQEALKVFSENIMKYDLLITDQTMPGKTGVELAQAMLELRPQFAVILCTGYSAEIDEEGAKQIGITGYLSKPFKSIELMSMVDSIIERNT